ncbi:hypothetical protein JTB14_037749 [Gonioctena quinquepunctata]|nr:hypothetical protein JTB14_037749 [Gonioctena quinquepunctata]
MPPQITLHKYDARSTMSEVRPRPLGKGLRKIEKHPRIMCAMYLKRPETIEERNPAANQAKNSKRRFPQGECIDEAEEQEPEDSEDPRISQNPNSTVRCASRVVVVGYTGTLLLNSALKSHKNLNIGELIRFIKDITAEVNTAKTRFRECS